MRKLLTYAIPMLLGVGLLTAAVHSDPQNGGQTKLQSGVAAPASQPAVIEEAAPPTTVTTAPVETTTTTAAPATTTTLPRVAPTTVTTARRAVTPVTAAPRPRPTTTTAPAPTQAAAPEPQVIDCGTGSANAKANLVNLGGGRYGLTATVINESTKAIELDELVVTADYGAAGKKQFTVAVSGRRVEARPGPAEATFSIPESEGSSAPVSFVISDFRFHTAGLPECTSH
jgi:cytoskeletal protein RodZ